MLFHGAQDNICLFLRLFSMKSYEDHSCRCLTLSKDQLSEVFVTGHEDRTIFVREPEHFIVRAAWCAFRDIGNLVALLPKKLNYVLVDIFIR